MPVYLRPNLVVSATLDCQSDLPESDRIVWKLRAPTGAELLDYQTALADSYRLGLVDAIPAVVATIQTLANGWSNIESEDGSPLPFDSDTLTRVFSLPQLWQIGRDIAMAVTLGEMTKKASPSAPE